MATSAFTLVRKCYISEKMLEYSLTVLPMPSSYHQLWHLVNRFKKYHQCAEIFKWGGTAGATVTMANLKDESKACWVEGHEREVVSDNRQTAKAAHGLQHFDTGQSSHANDQRLDKRIQRQHGPEHGHATTHVQHHLRLHPNNTAAVAQQKEHSVVATACIPCGACDHSGAGWKLHFQNAHVYTCTGRTDNTKTWCPSDGRNHNQ